MTNPIILTTGATVEIEIPSPPNIEMPSPAPTQVVIMPTPGIPGQPGSDGDGMDWWSGQGPPGTIVGSSPGDKYVDELTGTIYTLGD